MLTELLNGVLLNAVDARPQLRQLVGKLLVLGRQVLADRRLLVSELLDLCTDLVALVELVGPELPELVERVFDLVRIDLGPTGPTGRLVIIDERLGRVVCFREVDSVTLEHLLIEVDDAAKFVDGLIE
ncbi:hypothetical protein [Halorubrum sp. DM2]|uniref:hypothetical protein n=1 Tax=Halorubrum sp. DM2 TaxID=2527867 RepID=UPI0024B6B3EB|nr:hypothetical protein [Halorubrum sp. DM2]